MSVHDWNLSWNRKRCVFYIKKCSLDAKNHVFELFKSHKMLLESSTINDFSVKYTTIIGGISNLFQTLKRFGIPWTNMECDGWKLNTAVDIIGVFINLTDK